MRKYLSGWRSHSKCRVSCASTTKFEHACSRGPRSAQSHSEWSKSFAHGTNSAPKLPVIGIVDYFQLVEISKWRAVGSDPIKSERYQRPSGNYAFSTTLSLAPLRWKRVFSGGFWRKWRFLRSRPSQVADAMLLASRLISTAIASAAVIASRKAPKKMATALVAPMPKSCMNHRTSA